MDPIANMLVTIKNGYLAKKSEVSFPYSKFKLEIAKVLEADKFVANVNKNELIITDLTKFVEFTDYDILVQARFHKDDMEVQQILQQILNHKLFPLIYMMK